MELRTNQTVIPAVESGGNTVQEQGIELDYVLPDYYPDVCKLIKCFVTPSVTSESVSENRLSYELAAEIRILYCSENSHVLQCVTQTLHFSRTAELPAGETVMTEIQPVMDYVNCRAVSRRRLDVRGAMTIKMKTYQTRQQEALSDLSGRNIQLQKKPFQYQAKHLHTVNHIILSEELELGSQKPPLLQVIRCEAVPVDQNHKFVSGKLIAQGNLQIQILYACEKENDGSLEPMSFRIPYSQVIELDGVEEQDECEILCSVASCDLKPVTDENGDIRLLRCEAELKLSCTAVRMASESLVSDAFSTEHPCHVQKMKLLTSSAPIHFSEMQLCNTKLTCADCELDCVYDAWCEVRNMTSAIENAEICISGMLNSYILVRESSGMPRLLEKEEPFEHRFTMQNLSPTDKIRTRAFTENCSYTLSGSSEVSLKAELRMDGTLTHCTETEVLSDMEVQEEENFQEHYALKLYFGKAQENVWEIAKRCHTSVEAILEENDLTQEQLTENAMLLIPIIS